MSQSAALIAVVPPRSDVSALRLVLLRFAFGSTFLFVGASAWQSLVTHDGLWDPLQGVAVSFWAAYATLMLLGVRHPLKMLPLLVLQLFYKLVWLVAVAYPLWAAGTLWNTTILEKWNAGHTTLIFLVAVATDLAFIPWRYTVRTFVQKDA